MILISTTDKGGLKKGQVLTNVSEENARILIGKGFAIEKGKEVKEPIENKEEKSKPKVKRKSRK